MKLVSFSMMGAFAFGSVAAAEEVVVDFSQSETAGTVTNDGVMGGLSKGGVTLLEEGIARFSGTLSTENNGGFSSWTMMDRAVDLSGFAGAAVYCRGDGRLYKLRLQTDEVFNGDRVSFQAPLPLTEEWTDARVNFADLRATWRGEALSRQFDPSKVSSVGVIIADKVDGPFQLLVGEVKAVGENVEDAEEE